MWIDCDECTYRAIDAKDLAEHVAINPKWHPKAMARRDAIAGAHDDFRLVRGTNTSK